MKININNVDINYIQYGSGEDILLLHGWGQNIEMMKILGDKFSDRFRITIIDFPGFGNSSRLTSPWNMNDYVNMLEEFIKEVKIKKPIIIGHSFGGRVAIKYSSRNPIKKLVLFGSPCIRHTNNSFKVKVFKFLKVLPIIGEIGEFMKKFIGSDDYRNATPVMRETLVNIVNEDLSKYAMEIEEPTLLMWGDNDLAEPVESARELEKIMLDAALIVLPGSHYMYIEQLPSVEKILNEFFGG